MSGWHSADIKAAVEKKGHTLTSLAKSAGLSPMACRNALHARNIPGEEAIAKLIGQPLWKLWPDRWQEPASPGGAPIRIDNRRKDA